MALVSGARFRAPVGGPTGDSLCASGQNQSPIDVVFEKTQCVRSGEPDATPYKISRHYQPAANCTVQKKGRRIEVAPTVAGALGFITLGGCNPCDGARYDVKSISVRLPADHTIDGKRYAGEIQITHQKTGSTGDADLIITSVFLYQQAAGGFLNSFLENIDAPRATATSKTLADRFIDLEKLSESFHGEYFTYKGSLTWRGCPETVQWFLFKIPQGVDMAQLASIKTALGENPFKAAKPIGSRQVYWYRKRH